MRAMCKVLDPKAAWAYESQRDGLIIKNGLLYHKTRLTKTGEDLWHFIVPKSHRGIALDGCHCEAVHQGQRHSISLMQEQFWWPGMTRDMINKVKNRQVGRRQESLLVEAPAGAADSIQFHVLGSDGIQSSFPAFWQEAEDTGGLLVSNLARYASQV